jgi:hypothetical protein
MTVEYLFADSIHMADRAARTQGWHPHGRTGWIKPDGIEVHFICFEEQLAVVAKHVTIYFGLPTTASCGRAGAALSPTVVFPAAVNRTKVMSASGT